MPVATQEPSLPSTHNRNTRCSITSNSRTERVQPGCIRVSTKHSRISHILPLAERAYESGSLGDHAPRPGHEISGAMPTYQDESHVRSKIGTTQCLNNRLQQDTAEVDSISGRQLGYECRMGRAARTA